jgi:stage V sporulation protein B
MIPAVAQLVAANDIEGARKKIALSVKTTMIISIPCAVGILVLARPLTALLFTNGTEAENLATRLLMALSLSIVFYAYSTLNSNILQGIGRVNVPIINAGIALVLQSAAAVGLLLFTGLDLYSIAIANTLYSGVVCVLNQRAVRRAIGYRQEVKKSFFIPALASALMGAAARAVYEGLLLLTSSPRISVIPAVLVGAVVYFVFLILLGGVNEAELRGFPKGHLLVKAAKKCRLMR